MFSDAGQRHGCISFKIDQFLSHSISISDDCASEIVAWHSPRAAISKLGYNFVLGLAVSR